MKIKQRLKESILLRPAYNAYKAVKNRMVPKQDDILEEVFDYYKDRFLNYSGAFSNSMGKDEAYLFWLAHVVEKGLAMPNMKLGFGKDRVIELASKLDQFKTNYSSNSVAFEAGVDVLREYDRIHKLNNYELSEDTKQVISKFLGNYTPKSDRGVYTPDTFFANIQESFESFSKGRHSIRNFNLTEDVQIEELIDCIKLAQMAPSACNRQPVRVHIISKKDDIAKCLSLQNGNRGFGNLANKLLIVTGNLQTVLGAQEFFDLNTNAGMFLMNLSYSLYYHKIAHCILNWYALPKDDKALRKYIGIPDQENIVAFVVCGKAPEEFKVAISPRKDVECIVTCH